MMSTKFFRYIIEDWTRIDKVEYDDVDDIPSYYWNTQDYAKIAGVPDNWQKHAEYSTADYQVATYSLHGE